MEHFRIATRGYIDTLINKRPHETKLGEQVGTLQIDNWEEQLKNSPCKYVLLGIPEDIGVRANYGVGGTHSLWEPALKAILNTQHSKCLDGNDILVLGAFDLDELMLQSKEMDIPALREAVAQIDEIVHPVIARIVAAGKIPIVIGGGHNNAYPLIQATSSVSNIQINCINLDAHSDMRIMEGRHSGNGFTYAKRKGYLDKYAVVGLHENYNPQEVIDEMAADHDIHYCFYEDIFITAQLNYEQALKDAIAHTKGKLTGVELDLDCIAYTLASAATPCGISPRIARQYLCMCADAANVAYVHIAEGATHLHDGRVDPMTAKLVAYLVTDFIKTNCKYN
ncbi:MAG: formimidoylglutamase [Taibaiella sp.]|nr:formimidoylglutamase [Taibaiella sp.]